jgi:HEAT repeat protein
MTRVCLAAVLAAGLLGCRQAPPPPLAGGKPVRHWVEELKSPRAPARKKAVRKLGNVGPADPAVWPALHGALQDPDPGVRREAILALLKFGPEARKAAPTLRERRQGDPDPQVRAWAARALEKLNVPGGP